MNRAESDYVKAKTSVWWDIENCEVPRGWDAHAITKNVSSALPKLNYCGPVSISAYGDTTLIPLPVQQALSSTGVGLNHVPAGAKDASDKKILVDMLLWAIDNPAPANIMLISGDRDFSYALHQLRMRQYNILLAQPPHASVPLVAAAKTVWLWTGLASGCPPLTSAESSLLLSHGRSHVSTNNEVSKRPVSEQAQSSKPAGSTSVDKTKDNHVPGGLPQETRRNKLQNGRGTTYASVTSCNVVFDSREKFNVQLSDKRQISQAEFIANRKVQASVSAKPTQIEALVEPVFCTVCQISCISKDVYAKHTYGKKHRNNLEQQSGKSVNMSVGWVEPPKELPEKLKKKDKVASVGNHVCRMCNVVCQSQIVFDSHLRGQKHAAMLSQSEALIDSKKLQEKGVGEKYQPKETIAQPKPNANHVCLLCNVMCPSQIVFDSHLRGKKHIAMLSQAEVLTDSTKLQGKSVGEKDQPRETIVEPQSQSQNAQENSKCFEKHVVIVPKSEALVNSRKLEENGVLEKAQPIDTLAEPQSQSQTSREHTMFLEKQSKELREICGTSKGSGKDLVDVRCNYDGSREARECFDGIVKPVNLFKQATDHSGDVKNKKTEANSVASYDAQSIVSTKPIKEPADSQAVWCEVCQFSCNSKAAYANHTFGEKHRLKLEMQSTKNEIKFLGISKLSKVFFKNQTAFDLKSQNRAAMFKVQTEEALADDSRRTQKEYKQENPREILEQAPIVNSRKVQDDKEELKEENDIFELSKEPRGGLDVILKRVEMPSAVNVTEKLEDESKHEQKPKSLEHEHESVGRKEHPGAAGQREEMKGQADSFWTRLWGKMS